MTVAPTWDLNGNLTNDGLRTYGWDARNRLTAIAGVAAYAYDGLGRRIANTAGAAATKAYLYDGADIVQEQVSGAPTANLLTGLGVDERFSRATTGTGAATSTFLTDALGSTVALATAGGTIATSYGYDPYGATGASGAASDSAYQYAGRENDGTGLYYNRARYYNPTWGRFISEDPIGLGGGIDLYKYANNQPLFQKDPTGLSTLQLGYSLSTQASGAAFQLGGGIAIDSQGGIAGYASYGYGPGMGGGSQSGFSAQVSDANSVNDLSGPFANSSVSGPAGVAASLDTFTGTAQDGSPVSGAGFTLGAGGGASGSLTRTNTYLIQGNPSPPSHPTPGVDPNGFAPFLPF